MPFTTTYTIRFDDVDGAGILYYPRYFHLCHQTLEDAFATDGAPLSYPELIRDRRLGLPTVAIESGYRTPLEYGDTVAITLTVERIGASSMVLGFRIRREPDGTECFHARITTVLIDLDTRTSTPFPDDLRSFFEGIGPGAETVP
jgi:4-hydroxybenzoyl-CoA thioesterase